MASTTINIFEALTSFGHRIPEDNYNDYLAYLLDPKVNDGKFLRTFLITVLGVQNEEVKNTKEVSIYREVSYLGERFIDIEIRGVELRSKKKFRICIECKTNGALKSSKQLKDEYDLINDDRKKTGELICFLYLTPNHKNFESALGKVKKRNTYDILKWITWNKNETQEEDSIIKIIESSGLYEIDSMRHFLKHLKDTFTIKGHASTGKKIAGVEYKVFQYTDNSVYCTKIEGKEIEKKVKNTLGTLRTINDLLELRIEELKNPKTNTHTAAKLVIEKLKKIRSN